MTQLYSLQFVSFLVLALIVYFMVGRTRLRSCQWVVLLVASLGFYLFSGWQNLFFIGVTALSVWLVGLRFDALDRLEGKLKRDAADRAEKREVKRRVKQRKWVFLLLVMVLNFGILSYVKYWNVILGMLGAADGPLASHLLLPLGISVYTFQSIGYVIDCYFGKCPPERNFARFLLFVSYFPQLIQGPINRFDDLATQLYEPHRFDVHNARRALLLVGYGVFKKFAIADVLVSVVSNALDSIDASTPGCVIVYGIFLYAIYQYADFSGGIDMVRGVSQLFGIKMALNFRQPYFSVSIADFWHRWHITLGAWMRDYVFYPLALRPSMKSLTSWATAHLGKHVGRTIAGCIANIVVFFLVGLWHGAEMHYIFWGLYNGLLIASADLARPLFTWLTDKLRVNVASAPYHVFRIVRTFVLVCIGYYFDRLMNAGDLSIAFYNTIFNFQPQNFVAYLQLHPTASLSLCLMLAGISCLILFAVSVMAERGIDVKERILTAPLVVRFVIYAVFAVLVLFSFTLVQTSGGFMYANF